VNRLAVAVLVLVASCVSTVVAAPTAVVTFSPDSLSFEQYVHGDDTFQIPDVAGALFRVDSVAAPNLPFTTVRVLIPQNRTCTGVTITSSTAQVLEGAFYVCPTQTPIVMGEESGPFVEPDSAIYGSSTPFPESPAVQWREGYMSGYKLVTVRVYPLIYRPAFRELTFHSEVHISLSLQACANEAAPLFRRSSIAQEHIERFISGMVSNPADVEGYSLGESFEVYDGSDDPKELLITELPTLRGQCVEYVLITTDELADAFRPLLDWKTKKGVVNATRTVSWIDQHYTGCDLQERIRNFIKDAYAHWGTIWVLLGGDTRLLPYRGTTGLCQEKYSGPTDLYYGDLEGNWNANGNGVFGEVADSVDFNADIGLGRAPVENQAEVGTFVDKCTTYSKNPPCAPGDTYLSKILMAATGDGVRGDMLFGHGCNEGRDYQHARGYLA
jgi:hypothetical protein